MSGRRHSSTGTSSGLYRSPHSVYTKSGTHCHQIRSYYCERSGEPRHRFISQPPEQTGKMHTIITIIAALALINATMGLDCNCECNGLNQGIVDVSDCSACDADLCNNQFGGCQGSRRAACEIASAEQHYSTCHVCSDKLNAAVSAAHCADTLHVDRWCQSTNRRCHLTLRASL